MNSRSNLDSPPAIRVCQVGLGNHGLRQVSTLLEQRDRWEVTAVIDSSVASYARFQQHHFDERIPYYRSIEEAVNEIETDVVVVSSTAPSHVSNCLSIISNKFARTILVEKPISTNLPEARTLLENTRPSSWTDGSIGVDFVRRCSRLYNDVREVIVSGELGPVAQAVYSRPVKVSMTGSHYIDLANWLIGTAPIGVTADLDRASTIDHRGAWYYDPSGIVEVTYENGVTFILDAHGNISGFDQGLTVVCEKGRIFVDVAESRAVVTKDRVTTDIASDKQGPGYNWFVNTLTATVGIGQAFLPCTVEESITCLEIVIAAHLSSKNGGQQVAVPVGSVYNSQHLRVA